MSSDDSHRIQWWSTEFADRALEAEYRRVGLAFEVRWAAHAAWIIAAIILAFIPADYLHLGNTPPFQAAVAIRLAMVVLLLAARHWLVQHATPPRLDGVVLLTEVVLLAGFFVILPVRAEGFSLAALTALAVLLTMLLLAPGRFIYTVTLAMAASVVFLTEDHWIQSPPFHELFHVVLLFTVLQAYGIYILYQLNRNRRREFLSTRALHESHRLLVEEAELRRETHQLLKESESNFRALFEGAPVPLILSNLADGKVLEVNQAFLELSGERREEAVGKSTLKCYADPAERDRLLQAIERTGGRVNGFELQLRAVDGRIFTVLASAFRTTHLGDPALLSSLTDISDRKRAEEALRLQAETDPLTGLINRRGFLKRAEREVARWRRHGHPLSLVLFDIDRFKEVNDLFGHLVGDRILQAVAEVCQGALRVEDLCGRVGGDEFVLMLPDTPLAKAELMAERLRTKIEAMEAPPEGVQTTISLGIAEFGTGEGFDEALIRADTALYRAKEGGRNRVALAVSR